MVESGQGQSEDWWAAYVGRATALAEEAARVNAGIAQKWAARSLADDDWTIDTVTADVIEAWEHVTPLAGAGIDLWLEMVQQGLRARGREGPGS